MLERIALDHREQEIWESMVRFFAESDSMDEVLAEIFADDHPPDPLADVLPPTPPDPMLRQRPPF